jgi:hypothetical protein
MTYISRVEKECIASRCREICRRYWVRATFARPYNDTLAVILWEGALDFMGNWDKIQNYSTKINHLGYLEFHTFEILHNVRKNFSGECAKFLSELSDELFSENSDIFSELVEAYRWGKPLTINYLVNLQIGTPDKLYICKEKENVESREI